MNTSSSGRFATAVNCMDGRLQQPVSDFVRNRFAVDFVDMVTDAGVVASIHQGVLDSVKISVESHNSVGIAVVAHENCDGNPIPEKAQRTQCLEAAQLLALYWPELEVVPLWVPADRSVEIIPRK